ncbi:MAG TPA: carbonic anhydrase family protein [Vicinamibacterales bacterium]|nr:carbonic anhydrase family protein [Vicinamibacterales bacterium]
MTFFDTRLSAAVILAALSLAACSTPPAQQAPAASGSAAAPSAPPPATRPSPAPAGGDPVWHYEGAEGPQNWGKLSPKFAMCGEGRAQSPIDIAAVTPATEALAMKLNLLPGTLRIAHHEHLADGINNGHTIQINYQGADTLTIGADAYTLAQYHFHNESEHTVKGRHYPMEMHLVHKSASGKLAVVGVFIEEGAHNAAFEPIWSNLPKQKGQETHYPAVTVDVDSLLPADRASYRYDGSLTTPPCSEGVRWIVMATPIQLSAAQIKAFTSIIHDNNRPPQPLNGRQVLAEGVAMPAR